MKKSTMYFLAQVAVLKSDELAPSAKLEIIHELMHRENTEKFVEGLEENSNGESV